MLITKCSLAAQEFAQDEAEAAAVDDALLQDASTILTNFFGADGFSESMRWAKEDTAEVEPPAAAESAGAPAAGAADEDEDFSFPDEK